MKVIVIGGVAAGMSAASKLRRIDDTAEIIVYEKGSFLSYGACGLPYYVSNVNDDYKRMIIRTKEQFEKSGISCILNHEVLEINSQDKCILVKDLKTGNTFPDSYDKLMISTGACPVIPKLNGINLDGVFSFRTLEDGLRLKELAANEDVKNVVIIGAGYIGIELAEAMAELNKNVSVIELEGQILTTFDREISEIAEKELRTHNVKLMLKEELLEINGGNHVTGVKTSKGACEADLVILALGISPNTHFAKSCGINMAKNGAIIVDREMRTNIEDIYAAGDCAEVYHTVKQENAYIPLGTVANKCGRIAGENLAGNHTEFLGALGSAAIKVFDFELARTGLSEAEAKTLHLDYDSVFVEAVDRPPYYPYQTSIWIKVIYEKGTKRILGVQAAGNKGVVLRIDIFATAIQMKMTTDSLGMVDLCYAPPYAGVWDAVHIACNAAK